MYGISSPPGAGRRPHARAAVRVRPCYGSVRRRARTQRVPPRNVRAVRADLPARSATDGTRPARLAAARRSARSRPAFGPVGHRHRNRAVELHHGRRRKPREFIVERGDLHPVRLRRVECARVAGGDRGLQQIRTRADWPAAPRAPSASSPRWISRRSHSARFWSMSRIGSPAGAAARARTRGLDLHERDQPVHLAHKRRKSCQHAPEAQRLLAQCRAASSPRRRSRHSPR